MPGAVYLYGALALPEDRAPDEATALPEEATRLVWLQTRGSGEPRLPRLSPWTYHAAWGSPGATIATQAARALLARNEIEPSGLRFAATTIWVSRNWSVDDALTTILRSSNFGQGFRGVDQAAHGFFGVGPPDLGNLALARLVLAAFSPTRYDPWCDAEESQRTALQLLAHAGLEPGEPQPMADPPAHACP